MSVDSIDSMPLPLDPVTLTRCTAAVAGPRQMLANVPQRTEESVGLRARLPIQSGAIVDSSGIDTIPRTQATFPARQAVPAGGRSPALSSTGL